MKGPDNPSIALVMDIVGSRKLDDRQAAQSEIHSAFERARLHSRAEQEPRETVGDEFQAVFADWTQAILFTSVVRLALDGDVDVRFGMGSGGRERVTATGLEDGSAWWAAREAVTEARRRQNGRFPSCRSWFSAERGGAGTEGQGRHGDAQQAALINAYLLDRDAVITRMRPRERQWSLGLLEGRTQGELAQESQVSQPAVSQALSHAGATALVEGLKLMKQAGR